MTRIVVSVPRLIIGTLLVALLVVGTQVFLPAPQPRQIPSQTASVKQQSVPYTAAPQSVAQPAPTPTPEVTAPVTKTKAVATVSTTHSTTAAPVVTPAPTASVSGLTPVDPTPAPTPNTGGTSGASPSDPTPPATTTSYTSSNWSGYLAATGSYTAVSGSWTVPKATGVVGKSSADATWVGIGGVSSGDLIQVGTQNTVSSSGHQTASAFYEILPSSAHTITSLSVTPGDVVTASLNETTSGHWQVSIADTTTGQSYTTTLAYTSSHSSAEWIEEDPSTIFSHLIPFDNFGTVSFTGAAATTGGSSVTLTSGDVQPITMVTTGSKPVATPSALGGDGESFTVTRDS